MKAVRQPASLPLFQNELTLARLRRSARGCVRLFAPRAPLAPHGQPLGAVYVVLSGLVSLTSTSHSGRQAILALVGPGGVLGQESVLPVGNLANRATLSGPPGLDPHQVDAQALVACTTLALPAPELLGAFDRDPLLAVWLAASLWERVRALERGLVRNLSLPVRERVVDVLWELALTHGERQPWGAIIQIPLSQNDIAALVGATRESVNRALRQLEESGAVCRVDGAYAVRGREDGQRPEPGIS